MPRTWALLLVGGILLSYTKSLGQVGVVAARAGVVVLTAVFLFMLSALPVELNADRRAVALLTEYGLITPAEEGAVGRVLTAAALTYVAGLVMALLQLLRLLLILGFLGGRRSSD